MLPNEVPWHLATNYIVVSTEHAEGICWRYDRIAEALVAGKGVVSPGEAMGILEDVSQESTQWSVVYAPADGIRVVMGREYDTVHTFEAP